jgi:acyl-coenzyme A synthetase/AMP-(fatty) acid ligase
VLRALPGDVFIGSPPLAFTFGLGGLLLFPLSIGAACALVEKANPEALAAAIGDYRATVCFTSPTAYRAIAMLAAQHDLSSLRKCVSAGEALPAATRTLWHDVTGIQIIDGIGSTELLHIFISATEAQARGGATGYVVPGYEACVLGDDGRPLPPGQVGRLAVRGPTGCKYLADERQKTYVQDGWNLTGDAYLIDPADGQFVYQARTDDMIISGGYNIAGPEVESALLLHPAVAECGVIGIADEERGQGLRRDQARPCRRCGDGHGAADFRQADGGSLQVPAGDRVPRRAAAHRNRQAAALQVARDVVSRCGPAAGTPSAPSAHASGSPPRPRRPTAGRRSQRPRPPRRGAPAGSA